MKKLLLLFFSIWMLFSCNKEEIPQPIPDINDIVEIEDSVFYQLNVDGFELVAVSKDSSSLFLQTDSTFAFRCLYDSCGTNRLVVYSDSTGIVERIVMDKQVLNILYHEDKKKIDLFYKNSDKITWIKDVENPYKSSFSRVESGDVPYSAIGVMNNISYFIYNLINTYDLYMGEKAWKYIKKFSSSPYSVNIVVEMIQGILGKEYRNTISNYYSTIGTVMLNYSDWVKKELYGDACLVFRKYAFRKQTDGITLNGYMTNVDSLKNEFKVGVLVAEKGEMVNAYHNLDNQSSEYKNQKGEYSFSFSGLQTGKNYEFRSYLAPVSTSKYLTGMKSLLDYYKYGVSEDYLLLEAKAELKSMEDDNATIKLSVENTKLSMKMGVIYSEHSDILKHEYEKMEFEPNLDEVLLSNIFEKEIELENLKSGYVYYMPYIIYDDDILNRKLDYSINSDVIYETDQTFYGKKDSIYIINNPITGDAVKGDDMLTFKGHFDFGIENITEYGICFNKENKDFDIDNSSVLKANAHENGDFEVSMNINEEDACFYYRAYIKVQDGNYYYGDIKQYTTGFNIIGVWKLVGGDVAYSALYTFTDDGVAYAEEEIDGDKEYNIAFYEFDFENKMIYLRITDEEDGEKIEVYGYWEIIEMTNDRITIKSSGGSWGVLERVSY